MAAAGPLDSIARYPRRLVREFLRRRVQAALAASEGHFYVYDPRTDRLSRAARFEPFGALIRGRPVNPGYGGCDWFPLVEQIPYDDGIVFDVGGCEGNTSAGFSRKARRVFCFEPNPSNQVAVREQLRIRGIGNVELVPRAVSDRAGTAVLHVKPQAGHHSLGDVGRTVTIGRIDVETTTLDDFAGERGIDRVALLKVDVEGYEPEVFLGGGGLLTRRAIDAIVFEFSPEFYLQRRIDLTEPLRVLAGLGYRVMSLDRQPFQYAAGDMTQRDLLAFPPGAT